MTDDEFYGFCQQLLAQPVFEIVLTQNGVSRRCTYCKLMNWGAFDKHTAECKTTVFFSEIVKRRYKDEFIAT